MPKIQACSALARFKVIDLSRVRAGPNCVRILTDFGADVIRVEPPPGVDPNEAMFAANRKGGDFQNINRNKRSMTLNLKKPGAMEVLMRLVAEADVVVVHFTLAWRKLPFMARLRLALGGRPLVLVEHSYTQGYEQHCVARQGRFRAMLKLGMSLALLNQKADACQTLKALPGKYPKAESGLKERAKLEAQRAKCG
jgi:hypothetical protein